MNLTTRLLAPLAVALGTAAGPALAHDDGGDSYRELSAQWWQWALSIPVGSNPLLDPTRPGDPTAKNCMVGQRGKVWFLAGALGGGTVRRTCTVPEGVTLFIPVINTFWLDTPGVCGQGASLTVPEMRAQLAPFIDAATGLEVKVDNMPVTDIRRSRSVPFLAALPKKNLFLEACGGDLPPGIYSPSVADGYYVKVEGLAPGVHTVDFKGRSGSFELDIGYVLTVAPVSSRVKY